jgi:putative SOS response-associated peptidase YedK
MAHVWPGPPLLRCQRVEDKVLDPGGSAAAELRPDLERGAYRRSAGGTARPQRAPLARPVALGLIPYWSKDIKIGFSTINAMAETVATKPVFREASQRRRCLVPVDNFYEWRRTGKETQPYAIALADRSVMALAGLWETWRSRAAETVHSFTIVTTEPNELCARLHKRMPVVLDPTSWPLWLGEEPAKPDELKALLVPLSGGRDDVLAGQQARRQRQEQRPRPDRAGLGRQPHQG